MVNIASLAASLTKHEGSVPHMYLDSARSPKVTIGVGHNINANGGQTAAGRLTLFFKENTVFIKGGGSDGKFFRLAREGETLPVLKKGTKASEEHGEAEYAYVNNLSASNRKASAFDKETFLYMKSSDIKELLSEDIRKAITQIKKLIASENLGSMGSFDKYPGSAQQAIVNMGFNLGVPKLLDERNMWEELKKAIKAQDWDKAADESSIIGISKERNEFNKNLFRRAAMEKRAKEGAKVTPKRQRTKRIV